MGLQFYFGASGSGKSTTVYKDIIEWSKREPDREFLILVPDQFTMQTQKELCLLNEGIMNIDVLSFSRLTYRIFEEVGKEERIVLDDTGKNLILRKVAAERKEELKVLGSHLNQVGYIHEIKSVISEFMQYDIDPKGMEELISYGAKKGELSSKLLDLKLLYEGFLSFLKEKYITTEESLDLLCKSLHKSATIQNSIVVFDGFTGFTPVQNRLIQELMVQAREVIMTITVDTRENPYATDGEHKLFYLSKKTVEAMEKMAKEAGVTRRRDVVLSSEALPRFAASKELSHLERNLFRQKKSVFSEENQAVFLSEGANPREEIQKVCVRIKELLQKEQYCYRDIAIIAGDLEAYGHFIDMECKRYDIPVYLDQTKGVMHNPMVLAIISALQLILYDFSYDSVFCFLRTGLTGFSMEEIDRLEYYVKALGLRGRYAYARPFVRITRQMKMTESEEEQGKAIEKLAKLNHTREKFMTLMSPLLSLSETKKGSEKSEYEKNEENENNKIIKEAAEKPEEKSGLYPAEYLVRAVYDFCVIGGFQEKMEQMEAAFFENGDLAKAKEYGQIYPLVMDLLNQIYELLKEEAMSLQEFSDILTAGFSELKVGTIPQNADQVVAGDMERTRLKQVRALFFVGLNDNAIPGGGKKGGLISDMEREFLQESGIELAPTGRQQMFIQRLYLYLNMTKPSEKLFLSYSRVDREGKGIKPAYLLDVIKGLYKDLKTEGSRDGLEYKIAAKKDGLDDFAGLMGSYGQGFLEEDEEKRKEFFTLYHFYQKEEEIKKLIEAAFYEYVSAPLSKEAAKLIYGELLESSISRLEQFASCGYAHFLKYGLMLKEEEEFSFEAVDMGNVFHAVLEGFSGYLKEQGITWFQFTSEQAEHYVEEKLRELAVEYGETVLLDSTRNAYILKRMGRILNRTLETLQYQLKKGVFEPKAFELPFSMVKEFDGKTMKVRGRIDRMDTVEKDGVLYVKVMDYKSGSIKFDPVSLYYGLQMQLALYMNSAVLKETLEHPDKQVEPAALLYYQMTDPYVERTEQVSSKEQIEEAIHTALRTKGVVLEEEQVVSMLDKSFSDASNVIPVERKKAGGYKAGSGVVTRDELKAISQYADFKIKEIGEKILRGEIPVEPYEKGNQNPCIYCGYQGICGFDKKVKGFAYKSLDAMSKEEAMEKIREKVLEEGK
ncbi:MAG: PD-(D/E)XK nuclease family protein [Roseburia sp.]|nr:PD-(D/E)XK nuclease family protein [Roseburia sp.]MCM1278687.1 PD-(D/E)XK nuclease family protein [Robinsoniella sp.]